MKNLAEKLENTRYFDTNVFRQIGSVLSIPSTTKSDLAFILGEDPLSPFNREKVTADIVSLAKKTSYSASINSSGYELTKNITEGDIIDVAKYLGVYAEFDLRHVNEICKRHFLENGNILNQNIFANLFYIRDVKGNLSTLKIVSQDTIRYALILPFSPSRLRHSGIRFFFLG